jgi:hypothetical protein
MRTTLSLLAVLAVLALGTTAAQAATVDLGHPTLTPGMYNNLALSDTQDRSIIFDAAASFSITSAGIKFDPLTQAPGKLVVEIYAVNLTGGVGTRGALLATSTTASTLTDIGLDFYDVPVSYTFLSGNRYDVAFNITPGGWGIGDYDMELYSFDYPDTPYTVDGLATVLDGSGGATGYANFLMPHVRLETGRAVPLPAAAWLGLGLLGVLGAARRIRRRR